MWDWGGVDWLRAARAPSTSPFWFSAFHHIYLLSPIRTSQRLLYPRPVCASPGKDPEVVLCAGVRICRHAGTRPFAHRRVHHRDQRRFFDFNVWSPEKRKEKLLYMHRNPVVRGLVSHPKDWPWSSWSFYASGQQGLLGIDFPNVLE